MKYRKILVVMVACFLFVGQTAFAVDVNYDAEIASLLDQIKYLKTLIANIVLQKQTSSAAYMVMDLSNGSVLSQKNSAKIYPIASVTKLMNAVVSVENIDLNKTITLNQEILKPEGYSPSLYLGLNVSANNLLKASLIQSTNDAANALTYFVGNKQFLELMNQKAKDLGMNDTYYYDAYGLNPGNHSTAADLAKLMNYIYKNHPEILTITKGVGFQLPDPTGRLLTFQNVNGVHDSPDFLGGKSGYIPQAKQTLASVAMVNGKPIAVVLLYSNNRKTDALGIVDWLKKNN